MCINEMMGGVLPDDLLNLLLLLLLIFLSLLMLLKHEMIRIKTMIPRVYNLHIYDSFYYYVDMIFAYLVTSMDGSLVETLCWSTFDESESER